MRKLLCSTASLVADFIESLPSRPVAASLSRGELLKRLGRPLRNGPLPPEKVIRELAADAAGGLVGSAGPRYFGFVIGGAAPAGVAADWLTTAWDQNAQAYDSSPAASVVEEITARWLVQLLGLPASSSAGFVTGCQMANFTALAAARNTLLARAGWNIETKGLFGAPRIAVLTSDQSHATIRNALRLAGFGASQIRSIPSDHQGRLLLKELASELRKLKGRPVIVSAQAGNVHTGAFEPLDAISRLLAGKNAWLHVDGAFGLWAAVSPRLRHLLRGMEYADSWATDAHKWLNTPYDSGLVFIKDAAAHRGIKGARCAYAGSVSDDKRDGSSYAPENSRRARAFVLYAVLRSLGRSGVRMMVERCCGLAARFAGKAAELPRARILNEVVLNQVLIRFEPPGVKDDADFHEAVAAEVRRGGECWLGATRWKGLPAGRVSVSNWSTTEADIDRSVKALAAAVECVSSRSR